MENHIADLLNHIKGMNSQLGIQIGKVIKSEPELLIKVGDLQLDSEDFLISDTLLGKVSESEYVLKEGDLVVVMPTVDEQLYYVLCRVVSIGG